MTSVKCNLCNKYFKSLAGLSRHIIQTHRLSKQNYYIQYCDTGKQNNVCNFCGLPAKFLNIRDGYSKTCKSKKCGFQQHKLTMKERYGCEHSMQSKQLYEKRQKNNISKYGVKNVSQIERVKKDRKLTWLSKSAEQIKISNQLRQNTCLDKYGTRWISKTQLFKERRRNFNMIKYGVQNVFQSKQVKEKIKQTYMKKYGVQYAFQVLKIKNKASQTCLQRYGARNVMCLPEFKLKRKNTWLKIYGTDNPTKSNQIKEKRRLTCLARYGVPAISQVPQVKIKQMESRTFQCKLPIKRFTLQCGRIVHYQSKPELDTILQCENLHIDIYDGPVIPYQFNNEIHHYFSDFIIKNPISDKFRIVEIKGMHQYHVEDVKTGKFKAKCDAAIKFSENMNYDPYIVIFY